MGLEVCSGVLHSEEVQLDSEEVQLHSEEVQLHSEEVQLDPAAVVLLFSDSGAAGQ